MKGTAYLVLIGTLVGIATASLCEAMDYEVRLTLDIPWGDQPGEVGFGSVLTGYEGFAAGPSSFDVDESGAIYVLDTVNGRVNAYGPAGDYLRSFAVESTGRELGYIEVDDSQRPWIHDPYSREFTCYTPEGVLVSQVSYSDTITASPQFRVWGAEIHCMNVVLNLTRTPGEPSEVGERFVAQIDSRPNLRTPAWSGGPQGRIYKTKDPEITADGRLATPEVDVEEANGSHRTLAFRDADPLQRPLFLAEDNSGSVYFTLYFRRRKAPKEIRRYDADLKEVARIDGIAYSRGFRPTRSQVVDQSGRVYVMHVGDGGVSITVWQLR